MESWLSPVRRVPLRLTGDWEKLFCPSALTRFLFEGCSAMSNRFKRSLSVGGNQLGKQQVSIVFEPASYSL